VTDGSGRVSGGSWARRRAVREANLATPRGSYGPVDARGLTVLAGRKPHAILRAFPELGPAALRQATTGRRYTREDIQHAYAAKLERYAEIRRDAGAGMSERAIERRHHVGRRTIIKALDSADPPARKKIHREPAALKACITISTR
jgi:hypothetical protein